MVASEFVEATLVFSLVLGWRGLPLVRAMIHHSYIVVPSSSRPPIYSFLLKFSACSMTFSKTSSSHSGG